MFKGRKNSVHFLKILQMVFRGEIDYETHILSDVGNCGACGVQILDNPDGLPVELMDFAIEGDDPAGGESQEPNPAAEVESRS